MDDTPRMSEKSSSDLDLYLVVSSVLSFRHRYWQVLTGFIVRGGHNLRTGHPSRSWEHKAVASVH